MAVNRRIAKGGCKKRLGVPYTGGVADPAAVMASHAETEKRLKRAKKAPKIRRKKRKPRSVPVGSSTDFLEAYFG